MQHLTEGRSPSVRLVCSKFRDLVEKFDPGINVYEPSVIDMGDGSSVIGQYCVMKTMRSVRRIDVSSAQPIFSQDGGLLGGLVEDKWAVLEVYEGAFDGLHFWRDDYILNRHFCSEGFLDAASDAGLEPIREAGDIHYIEEGANNA